MKECFNFHDSVPIITLCHQAIIETIKSSLRDHNVHKPFYVGLLESLSLWCHSLGPRHGKVSSCFLSLYFFFLA